LVPVLCHFNPERKIVVETNASNLVVAGVLLQYDNNSILHQVAYFSRKSSPAEINHEIYNEDLLAIVCTFKKWLPLLEGSPHTLEVISNHQNLMYFTTNYLLNYCQTHWSEFLSYYDITIDYEYRKGHGKADTFTC
jgi:hypothetical protein